jgi:polar amino acid transport system substrate-binding protein
VNRALVVITAAVLALAGCAGTPASSAGSSTVVSAPTYDAALHDSLPTWVRERGVLRVGTDASYAPASFFAADGHTIIGFEPDLAQEIGEVLGVRLEFVVTDFDQILTQLREHKLDLAMAAITDTAERERDADFITYFTAGTSIVVQRGNPHGIIDLKDLCGTKVAVEAGTVQVDLLTRASKGCDGPAIDVQTYDTNADALLQLRTGRVVAVLNDFPPAAYLASDDRTRAFFQLVSDTQYEPGLYGIGVATNQPVLRDAVHAALDRVIRSGQYGEILHRWGVEDGAVAASSINAAGGATRD